jgi:hypothetical protein
MNIFEIFPRIYTRSPPIHLLRFFPFSSFPLSIPFYLFLFFELPLSLLQVAQRKKKNIGAKSIAQDNSKVVASLQQRNGISGDLLFQLE